MRTLFANILLIGFIICCPLTSTGYCADVPTFSSMIIKMSWALLVVAGLILIIYGLLRKKMGYKGGATQQIKVVEMRPLVNKNALALVEVKGRYMLLGIGNNSIQLLSDFGQSSAETEQDFQQILDDAQ